MYLNPLKDLPTTAETTAGQELIAAHEIYFNNRGI